MHSAKDLPAEDDDGFMIAAVPLRADPGDVLICRNPGELAHGAVIGTSSLRRRAQLLAAFPGSMSPTSAATSARGCRSWPMARWTPWCWPRRGWRDWD